MIEISKELLSEVLGLQITNEFNFTIEDNHICISDYGEQLFEINIYELAHKCINYFYDDYIFSINAYQIIVTRVYAGSKSSKNVYENCWCDKPYKIEEIFKACEWILKEIK